jgi:hypothetical protein
LEGGDENFQVINKINEDGNGKIKRKKEVVEVEAVEGRNR